MSIIEHLIDRHVRQPARDAVRHAMTRWCAGCQKSMPLGHTCEIKTDFKARRRQAERHAKAADRRKARAARRKSAGRKPQERQAHDYRSCTDPGCQRRMCVAYREGFEAGIDACPKEHV